MSDPSKLWPANEIRLVSVIVPCRNEIKSIDLFLAAVFAQARLPCDFEVIIADGMSTDGTRDRLAEWAAREPRIRLIDNPEHIVPTALNRAIHAARGDIIIRLDAHSEYADDYLFECVRVLLTTGADNVGGPMRTRAATSFQVANAAAHHSWFAIGGGKFHDPGYSGPVDTVPYGCWRRQTLIDLGLFDESLVRNQDDELNLRLTLRGGRIWQSESIRLWYQPRGTLRGLFRQYYQYGYWKVAVIRKHRQPASIRHLVPVSMVLFGIGLSALGLAWRPAWWILASLAAVYLGLSAVAAIQSARRERRGWLAVALPAIFFVYHFSYGTGFLMGLIDALIGRSPAKSATSVARH
jgi:glycosyltransferase involved in cell wall biosynthesis